MRNNTALSAPSGADALRAVLSAAERSRRSAGSTTGQVVGAWRIDTNPSGDLVAVHIPSKTVKVLATSPAGREIEEPTEETDG